MNSTVIGYNNGVGVVTKKNNNNNNNNSNYNNKRLKKKLFKSKSENLAKFKKMILEKSNKNL